MNLLITGAWSEARKYIPIIEEHGHSVCFQQNEKDNLVCDSEWIEGVVCNGLFLVHPIEKFTNLKYIQLTSAGLDRVPLDYIRKHNIEIHNARGVYSIPMAEFALGGVLQIYKQSSFFMNNQKKHKWEKNRSLRELDGRIVSIFGCGSVGTECARRFEAMGCIVIGIDSAIKEQKFFSCICDTDKSEEILSKSDIVIITLPLTDKTVHMFDRRMLKSVKKGAVLVNISRGALVDCDALFDELNSGRFSAVLDAFESEPLGGNSPLWNMENVIISPHNSFVGDGNDKRLSEVIMKNLKWNNR